MGPTAVRVKNDDFSNALKSAAERHTCEYSLAMSKI